MSATPRATEPELPPPPSPDDAPRRVRLRVSLLHGDAPADGLADAPFHWGNLLEAPPPRPIPPGEHRYAIAGDDLTDPELRMEDVVLARVMLERGEHVLDLEHVIAVQERAMAGAIVAEEETVGAAVDAAEESGQAALDRQEASVESLSNGNGAGVFAARVARPVVRLERRVLLGGLHGVRKVTRGLVAFPDLFRDRWKDASAFLHTRAGRARFRYGLTHPQELPARQKAVTLFVSLITLTVALALLHFAVTLAVPAAAETWRVVLALFTYAVVTSLGIPLPIEPLLFPAALAIGNPPVIAITVLAKVVAAYLVFFLGDEVNAGLQKRAETSPRFAKWLARSETFARRFGVLAMALFIATPGLPDAIALYVFGSLGMRLGKYLLGVAIGGVALYTAILYGVGAALGF